MSSPRPPIRVSLPPAPSSVSLPLPPVMVLASSLPVPAKSPLPANIRFSRLAAIVRAFSVVCTVSVPLPVPLSSTMTSSRLSTR
ncbi:MAG: hypothetical protein C0489_11265 [Candidatus Accumulibacter sp.]|nr:hypothetical protein [Accumulibacter sp.]